MQSQILKKLKLLLIHVLHNRVSPRWFSGMSVDDFAGFVVIATTITDGKNDEKMLEILYVKLQNTAVKVREHLGMIFVDCLSFLKKDEWKIYTKLFHVES